HAAAVEGLDLVLSFSLRLAAQPKQMRDAGTVDVGIEQADFRTRAIESQREASGNRALTHAPFAAANGDDALGCHADRADRLSRTRMHCQIDVDFLELWKFSAEKLLKSHLRLLPQRRRMRRQGERQRQPAVGNLHVAHLLHLRDATAGFWISKIGQCRKYRGWFESRHWI